MTNKGIVSTPTNSWAPTANAEAQIKDRTKNAFLPLDKRQSFSAQNTRLVQDEIASVKATRQAKRKAETARIPRLRP